MAAQTFNISMPVEFVKKLDKLAKQRGFTRSAMLRIAAIEYIKQLELERKQPEGNK